ncbi:hypothetical protein SKM54_04885 [Acinetobacter faecalis]|uniref:DUF6988 family protein n=1 Tax=Acinetobacter faecalis TaxID=2665161 RepID=UPI002A90E7F2|nr:hypothetical protein [Acinetobacter faecalis]MDY6456097.1 hypothetical protein [Acinetobacter faecalis]MDY6481786.1 hypothetical protein [Acinetobacter faecalis]
MNIHERSNQLIDAIYDELNDRVLLDAGVRTKLAYHCCEISIKHGIAVRVLIEQELYASALGIFRMQFESVLRSYWILLVASNDEILKLDCGTMDEWLENHKVPMISKTLDELSHVKEIEGLVKQFREFQIYSVNHLNSVVHTGKYSFMHDQIGLGNKLEKQIICQSNNLISMIAQLLFRHAGIETKIHEIGKRFSDCLQVDDKQINNN